MKEDVLDVLAYLYEHFLAERPETPVTRPFVTGQGEWRDRLLEVGFGPHEIDSAIGWLQDLTSQRPLHAFSPNSVRLFTEEEQRVLEVEARGLLCFLEQVGVLSPESRELAIERALALHQDSVDSDDMKWVVLLVLFSQPGEEAAHAWMEDFFSDLPSELPN